MATEDSRKLFMAGLPDSVTEEVLRGLLSETGANVTELTLPRDRQTGRPRGFAFVRLGSDDEAERARQDLDGRIVDGKMISVRPFHADPPPGGIAGPGGPPRGPREGGGFGGPPRDGGGYGGPPREGGGGFGGPPREGGGGFGGPPREGGGGFGGPPREGGGGFGGPPREGGGGFGGPPRSGGFGGGGGAMNADRTLYVGNLPYDASQEELDTMFRNAGAEAPARVNLPVDQDGRKRGFGFVTMASADAANAALEALKNADLRGRRLAINIAHPKGDRPGGGGPPGGGGFGGPPRTFGGPPGGGGFGGPPGVGGPGGGSGFGPPAAPKSGKGEGRSRKFEGRTEGATAAAKPKREKEERWRDNDDDDW